MAIYDHLLLSLRKSRERYLLMELISGVFFLRLNLHNTQVRVISYGYHILIQTLTVCINQSLSAGGYKGWHREN